MLGLVDVSPDDVAVTLDVLSAPVVGGVIVVLAPDVLVDVAFDSLAPSVVLSPPLPG